MSLKARRAIGTLISSSSVRSIEVPTADGALVLFICRLKHDDTSGFYFYFSCFDSVWIAPDMTAAVDWALKTNYLSIYLTLTGHLKLPISILLCSYSHSIYIILNKVFLLPRVCFMSPGLPRKWENNVLVDENLLMGFCCIKKILTLGDFGNQMNEWVFPSKSSPSQLV